MFERSETIYRMHADGTGERDVHALMRIQSEGAARQFAVLTFSYASASETPKIVAVRVHKADGTVVETPVADAIEMSATVTREAPLYSDLKEKHLPVRSLSVGDTLEYEVRTTIEKPEAAGQFWGADHFTAPGSVVVLAEVLALEVPKDKYVQVWSPNHKPTVTEHDGVKSYSWNVAQLVPSPKKTDSEDAAKSTAPKDPDLDADGRALPSVAWTTFHNWAEVGDWYRSLAAGRAQPNDALRAKADEITKDAKTPDEQVQAIYSFVSTKTRYVGIDFGVGRYQPHAAADVLANQYGDCKDKDTLLEALLRAKGFSTAPALIGAGIAPVPEVPSPAVFNHVITTVNLPSGRIWLDSTPEVAPYQLLSATIRDQKALVVPADGPASLELTPANAPYPFVAKFEAVGTLDAEGKFTSHIVASYRTDDELIVRALARSIAPAEWDKASQYVSSTTGFGGTTSNTTFSRADDLTSPIVMTYDYSRHPYGDWADLRIVPALPVLEFNTLASDTKAPEEDIDLGAPRTLTAISRIRLPEGYRTDLPDPIHVKTDFATFDKTYRFDGKEIVVERDIKVVKNKLPKADWKKYQTFTKDISLEGEPWIQLIRPAVVAAPKVVKVEPAAKGKVQPGSTKGTVTVQLSPQDSTATVTAEEPPSNTASAQQLMQIAAQQMQHGDMDGATATLDRVKAKNPNEEYLWAIYGAIAESRGNLSEAEADYRKELAAHPDNALLVRSLASVENKNGDSLGARRTLQSFLSAHPEELRLSQTLATMQTAADDNQGALKTLQSAAENHPDDRFLRLQLSTALLQVNRKDEAVAAAKSALDGAEDPLLLNNGAYVLGEAGLNLAYAEEVARKAVSLLEEKTASITTAEVNSNAFAQSNLMANAWDTLGWILFREDKMEDARALVAAAWRNNLMPEGGDHLGQIYEAMDKKGEALKAYQLAHAAIGSNNATPPIRKHITESIVRLGGEAKPGPWGATQELQDSRTYRIPRPEGVSGWGTFRLQITTTGVIASQQMSGEQKLANIKTSIEAMKFPELVPPQSKAHLLRSAVVSCSGGSTCELVLVPDSNLNTEGQ